jgi:hypothetical protein
MTKIKARLQKQLLPNFLSFAVFHLEKTAYHILAWSSIYKSLLQETNDEVIHEIISNATAKHYFHYFHF